MNAKKVISENKIQSVFLLRLFNAPQDIKGSDFNLDNENIESWEFLHAQTMENSFVATIKFTTKQPCSSDDLEGNISLGITKYEVQGVDVFVDGAMEYAKCLWAKLGNTPVNDDNETEEAFLHFESGTDCHDIWHWFESEFNVSVATDLMNLQ